MKVLIWFGCIFLASIIRTIFEYNGVILGAIPTVIIYGCTIALAKFLCKKWEERKEDKEAKKQIEEWLKSPAAETTVNTTSEVRFCRKCGEKLINNSQFCSKCGTEVIKE